MSELNKVIKTLINNKDEKETSIRINVSLLKHEHRRLELVSKLINKPKQSIIEDLFMAALKDIEEELGLRKLPDEYEKNVRSDIPVADLVDRYKHSLDALF